jgi:hypothetical protein
MADAAQRCADSANRRSCFPHTFPDGPNDKRPNNNAPVSGPNVVAGGDNPDAADQPFAWAGTQTWRSHPRTSWIQSSMCQVQGLPCRCSRGSSRNSLTLARRLNRTETPGLT